MCIFAAVPAAAAAGAAASAGAGAAAAWAITPAAAFAMNAAIGTSIIAGIGTPIYSYFAQQQAARSQADYQNRMYEANKQIAEQSLLSQYADISLRQQQETEKAAQEMRIISAQARQVRATAAASALESGVSGLSIDNIVNDYTRKESEALYSTQRQLRGTLFQFEQTKKALGSEYQGRVLGMTPRPVEYPDIVATGLKTAGAAAGLYSDIFINTQDRQILRSSLRI